MNEQKDLWEKLAKSNSKYYINSDKGKGITDEEFRESGRLAVKQFVLDDPYFRFGTFVEIGCGTGRMTEFISWNFEKVYALDISGEMIRQAKERLKDIHNIEFIETDGATIPLEDGSVDYVFSYLVFQHIKTKEMVEQNFMEVSRILKMGGMFKVLLRTDEQKDLSPWWSGVHYDGESIKEICDNVGLNMVKLEYVKDYAMWAWLQK